jgi:hypothetical protein
VSGEWRLHYVFSGTPAATEIRQADYRPLTKKTIGQVLNEMSINAASAL